jgi:hypothetical protein
MVAIQNEAIEAEQLAFLNLLYVADDLLSISSLRLLSFHQAPLQLDESNVLNLHRE